MKDRAVNLLKGPPLGISPCNLLYDRFIYLREESDSNDFGITPVIRFCDKSKKLKLNISPSDVGIRPFN
jgi:hypothetical protein